MTIELHIKYSTVEVGLAQNQITLSIVEQPMNLGFLEASAAAGNDGADGLSAYQIAVNEGFVGDEVAWLASLVGATGPQGEDGAAGPQGIQGETGAQGATGPQGLQGPAGNDGADGSPGLDGAQGVQGEPGPQGLQGPPGNNGVDGEQGIQGIQGPAGNDGANGADGADGLSAYQIAVNEGFVGDEATWLASLVGATGPQGADGVAGPQGIQGETGPQGPEGPAGSGGGVSAEVVTFVNTAQTKTIAANVAIATSRVLELNTTAVVGDGSANVSAAANGTITLQEGTYLVAATSYWSSNGTARSGVAMRFAVNGALEGGQAATGYIRRTSGHDEASGTLAPYAIVVPSGQTRTVQLCYGNLAANGGTITYPAGTSHVTIQKTA